LCRPIGFETGKISGKSKGVRKEKEVGDIDAVKKTSLFTSPELIIANFFVLLYSCVPSTLVV
jgi:hypothetical protein